MLPLAPLVHGSSHGNRALGALASVPYVAGSLVCHQRPERSFTIRGVPWPVCGRCAGLYLSAALGAALFLAAGVTKRTRWEPAIGAAPPGPSLKMWRTTLLAAAVPTSVSWVVERAGWWLPGSATRAWLAVPLGAVIGVLLASVARMPRQTDAGT